MLKRVLSVCLAIAVLVAVFGMWIGTGTPKPALAAGVPYNTGDIFAGVGNGQIKHFNSAGVLLDTLDTGTNAREIVGMTFDPAGNLYSTNWGAQSLSKFDNAGNLIGPFSTVPFAQTYPSSIVQDSQGNFYVGNGLTPKLTKLSSTGAVITNYNIDADGSGPENITLAADNCTIYYTSFSNIIHRFNACTSTQLADFITIPVGGNGYLYNLRILPDGRVLVAGNTRAYIVNAAGTVATPYPHALVNPIFFAMNLDPDGVSFWLGEYNTGNVYKYLIDLPALPVFSFNTAPNTTFSGLSIFGEPLVATAPPPPLAKKQTQITPPDMVMQLRVEPNRTAAISTDSIQSVVSYTLTLKNMGQGKADSFMVNFPIDAANEEILSVSFPENSADNPKSWVTEVVSDNIKIEFGSFEASSPVTVSAVIRVGIKSSATSGASVLTRATGWASWAGGGALQTWSNSVGFQLGVTSQGDDSKGAIQAISAAVSEDGTVVIIGGDIFIPGEIISGWLNLPDGSVREIGTNIGRADQNGLILVGYSLVNVPTGNYSVVLYGQRSGVQGVGSFTVTTQSLNRATSLPGGSTGPTYIGR